MMVLFIPVILKTLFDQGRKYAWPRPSDCPHCGSATVWGHGFAEALFDGYNRPLLLKLYRCPDCGCVIRLRPEGYFKRFQAPVEIIRASILCKSVCNRWLAGIDRCRQCHWFNALKKKTYFLVLQHTQINVVYFFHRHKILHKKDDLL